MGFQINNWTGFAAIAALACSGFTGLLCYGLGLFVVGTGSAVPMVLPWLLLLCNFGLSSVEVYVFAGLQLNCSAASAEDRHLFCSYCVCYSFCSLVLSSSVGWVEVCCFELQLV